MGGLQRIVHSSAAEAAKDGEEESGEGLNADHAVLYSISHAHEQRGARSIEEVLLVNVLVHPS